MDLEISSENKERKTRKKSDRGKDTLYRIILQNQLRSIAIVDQKANIIIGINTILISIIIATVSIETHFLEFDFLENIALSLPFTILLLSCFASGVISIIVVRPASNLWVLKNPSQLFFRDYKNENLDFFKSEMKTLTKSDKKIYEALDVDIYLYGKTVQRKFRLLRWAYLVFMIGLSLTVFLFFILRFLLEN
jgi:hypothetical protein